MSTRPRSSAHVARSTSRLTSPTSRPNRRRCDGFTAQASASPYVCTVSRGAHGGRRLCELRSGQPPRREVLLGVRHAARATCPQLRRARLRRQVLQRVRGAADPPPPCATVATAPHRRRRPVSRAPDRVAAVRRPGRVHAAVREPRPRSGPRAAVGVLRACSRGRSSATAARSRSSSVTPSSRSGACRPRARTTPSAPCAPASTSSSTVAALGQEVLPRVCRCGSGITTGQVAVTLGAVGEGMVAGDAVNTASRVQSRRQPGRGVGRRPDPRADAGGLAYEPSGSTSSRARLSRSSCSAPCARRSRSVASNASTVSRHRSSRRDRELRIVKELFHAHRRGAPRPARAGRRRARHRQVAAGLGVREVRRRDHVARRLAARSLPFLRPGRRRPRRRGDGAFPAPGDRRRRRGHRPRRAGRRLERHVDDPAYRELLRPRLESLLGLADGASTRPTCSPPGAGSSRR